MFVAIDPAYLAVRGTQASSLVDVGEALEEAQHVCQDVGAALLVSHHFNQTGSGTGAERFSGAGWAEWGRVLVSMSVTNSGINPSGRSTTAIRLELRGDEISDQSHEYRREVWTDDPNDLNSPMHYQLGSTGPITQVPSDGEKRAETVAKVLGTIADHPGVSSRELRAKVGGHAPDVDKVVAYLVQMGELEVQDQGPGRPKQHWASGTRLQAVES